MGSTGWVFQVTNLRATLTAPLSLRKDGYVIKGNLGGLCGGAFIRNVDAAYVVSMGRKVKDDMKHPRVRGPLIQCVWRASI